MKKGHIIQFLFVFRLLSISMSSYLCAQNIRSEYLPLYPLEAGENYESIPEALCIGNDKILYSVANFFEPPGLASLRLIDINTHHKYSYDYHPLSHDTSCLFNNYLLRGDTIIGLCTCVYFDDTGMSSDVYMFIFDSQLLPLNKVQLETNIDAPYTVDAIENANHNIVVAYFRHLAEYDLSGNLIHWIDTSSFLNSSGYPLARGFVNIAKKHDNSYLCIKRNQPIVYKIDSVLKMTDYFTWPNQINPQCYVQDKVLFDAEESSLLYGGIRGEFVSIVKIDSSYNLLVSDYDTIPDEFWRHPSRNIDSYYSDYRFLGIDYDLCMMMGPGAFQDCEAKLNVYCVDEDMTLRWKKTLGGDANYHLTKVLATPDSGCLVFMQRYSSANYYNHKTDAYYLKLDKYGNPQPGYLDTYTSIDTTPAMPLAQLRYDITTQALYLPPQLTGGSYRLYHSNGALLESFTATDSRIGLEKWPPGLYLYDYTTPDGHPYRGKVVK